MLPITVVLIILICISYIYLNYHRRRSKIINNVLPGPRTLPVIGNAYCLFRRSPNEILNILTKWAEDYPSPFQIWMGNKLFIFVNESDQIKTILQNNQNICLNKSKIYNFFKPLLGKGILTALVALMDVKVNSLKISQFLETMTRLKIIVTSRAKNLFLYPDFIFNLTSARKKCHRDINFIHIFIDEIIKANKTRELIVRNRGKTFYDILMGVPRRENYMYDDFTKIFNNNILFMLLAASETTAITLNFVIFILANFPETQEKVYKELREIYGIKAPKSTRIKYEDLQRMNYLENVIKETLRLFPVGPLIARELTEDINIRYQTREIILPKDADVVIQIMTAQRNKKYWPNPLVFDPDRFLPENIRKSDSFYMPFSLGSRNCMGEKYAMILMKVFLSTLVRTFVFKIDESIQIDQIDLHYNLLLNFAKPIKIRIEKRDLHEVSKMRAIF
ncbi:cytochrome P450 4C1-like isoform X2 [Cataglyphis hispanica]|uniref:cytochrome P450 4C1-like isoform X2 n=1 Tax=Cataglyphis hispanica TaxID=1086592 RepID=UPI00217F73F1|nr:cytochrome P450 4C1-like isoform X2 [Cataglyphis hispanica]